MPSTIFSTDKTISYTTEKEKCDAFSDLFAKSHELTHNDHSQANVEVRHINSLYNNENAIINFSPIFPANFVCDHSIGKHFINQDQAQFMRLQKFIMTYQPDLIDDAQRLQFSSICNQPLTSFGMMVLFSSFTHWVLAQ